MPMYHFTCITLNYFTKKGINARQKTNLTGRINLFDVVNYTQCYWYFYKQTIEIIKFKFLFMLNWP